VLPKVAQPAAQAMPAAAPAMRPAQPAPTPVRPMPQPAPAPAPAFNQGQHAYGLDGPEELAEEEFDTPAEAPFIPPAPEAPARIPRVEDFPPVVQRQIEARQRGRSEHHEDRGPMSLLRRLASVGLGRRDEEPAGGGDRQPPQVQRPAARAAQPQQRQIPPQPRAAQPAPRQAKPEAPIYRPAQGDLDPHGRPQPAARPQDDELEIPAFLRRQSN
jgi:cell division protein FtsZ